MTPRVTDEAACKDPLRLLALLRGQQVERLVLPFVALQQLAEQGQVLEHLREVATSGEQLYITPALCAFFGRSPTLTCRTSTVPPRPMSSRRGD